MSEVPQIVRVYIDTDTREVPCEDCEGYGQVVDWGYSYDRVTGARDEIVSMCGVCHGAGMRHLHGQPVAVHSDGTETLMSSAEYMDYLEELREDESHS